MDANIGHKIYVPNGNGDTSMVEIWNIIPVKYKDDGEQQWYEVCKPSETNLVMISGVSRNGEDLSLIIEKNEKNMNMLIDLI